MIQVIGIKRIIVLLVFVVLNTVLAGFIYMYAIPQQEKTDITVRTLRNKVAGVRSDIGRIAIEFEQLEKEQDKFDKLKASGFFSLQDRSHAKDILTDIQKESKVISAVANIKSGYVDNDKDAQRANYVVLLSPIEIDITAFDDADVYRYLELARERFPGYLGIEDITITRQKDITPELLRAIASGANPELIKAKVVLIWHTMVEKSVVTPKEGG